jgi:hypothetical protein
MEHRACRSKAGEGRSAARLASFAEEHRDESHLSSPGGGAYLATRSAVSATTRLRGPARNTRTTAPADSRAAVKGTVCPTKLGARARRAHAPLHATRPTHQGLHHP